MAHNVFQQDYLTERDVHTMVDKLHDAHFQKGRPATAQTTANSASLSHDKDFKRGVKRRISDIVVVSPQQCNFVKVNLLLMLSTPHKSSREELKTAPRLARFKKHLIKRCIQPLR